MTDDLYLSPFERTHVGQHGAFVLRINRDHVEEAKKHILARRLEEVRIEVSEARLSCATALPLARAA